jgi:hypothetical protein
MGLFVWGVFLGGRRELGYGRTVYLSFRQGDKRLHFLCQVGVGLPVLPAVIQAAIVNQGSAPIWRGFMAPPRIDGENCPALRNSPSLDELNKDLSTDFELATVYTMIAGLLNILAIYDACAGPVVGEGQEEKEGEEDQPPPKKGAQS